MTIYRIPFEIGFPIKILTNKRVNFEDKKEREKIFKRHIYYYKHGKIKNIFLEERSKIFFGLARKVKEFLGEKYPSLDILSISIFGSSLYSKNNGDFDFLVITKGNKFSYNKTKLTIIKSGKKIKHLVGISIKGVENLSKGIFDSKSNISLNLQSQIIYRTTISLFRRHIPLIGYDFVNNKRIFLKNGYAQISDLLSNAYELYYLKNRKSNKSDKERSRKILSRIYEAISYMDFLKENTKDFKKKIVIKIKNGATLKESKNIFDKVVLFYKKRIEYLNDNFKDKRNILAVLSNENLRKNIKERLENYWKSAKLPFQDIGAILKILSKYKYNEDLAIKEVRREFPSLLNKDSSDYSKRLEDFRKIKVKNLTRRIKKDISGKLIADIGGRADDFVEQILHSNKEIKKAYVTDLCSFTTRSKNPKIDFVVQSSSTKIPFSENTIDTILLSMVLHHLKKRQQKEIIKNLTFYLKDKGRIILIEDTFPEKINLRGYDKITKCFLKFRFRDKKRILCFYDWFGNRLMRNRDNIPLFYNYKTMEKWKKIFERYGMKQIRKEFIKENKFYPDIFPPKAILIFQKNKKANN